MKILFLSSLYPPQTRGGGELSTHYIAQGLTRRGHDVTVITGGDRAEDYELDGVQVKRLALPLAVKPLLEARHSKKMSYAVATAIGDTAHYDIIHAHDFRTVLALSYLQLPNTTLTARDYAQICGSTNNLAADGGPCPGCTWTKVWQNHRVAEVPFPRKFFRAWQYAHNIDFRKAAFRTFKHHIYISQAQLDETTKQQDLTGIKTTVIYNPVSEEYLRTPVVDSPSRNILYVGTVEAYKGVGLLLDAFRNLANQFTDMQLTIVGEGAQRAEYEQQVASWGMQYRVHFIGRVAYDKLRRYYDEAGIVVAPHIWVEPFGRTVAEAMSRGKIVVAANTGGPCEIIQDGATGLLFEKGSADSLTAKLSYALKLRDIDKREIQTRARTWVEKNLTIDSIAQQHEDLYRAMA